MGLNGNFASNFKLKWGSVEISIQIRFKMGLNVTW